MANLPGGSKQARRVYGYTRAPERPMQVVVNNITRSFDAQNYVYNRDFFYIYNDVLGSISASGTSSSPFTGQYDEDIITLNWETSATKTFNVTFASTPIVVLDVIQNLDLENVNVYITAVSTTQVQIATSAPFTGTIRYRAIYAATYPATVQRNVISSAFSYTAVAGYVDVVGLSYFTASYTSLGGTPTSVFFTTFDVNANSDANVAFTATGSYGTTSTSGDISSAIVNRINFIVVQ
jgi:hypothetical protein